MKESDNIEALKELQKKLADYRKYLEKFVKDLQNNEK